MVGGQKGCDLGQQPLDLVFIQQWHTRLTSSTLPVLQSTGHGVDLYGWLKGGKRRERRRGNSEKHNTVYNVSKQSENYMQQSP
jgi:hypothetical protein